MIETIINPWDDKLFNYISKTEKNIKICCPFVKFNILKDIYEHKSSNVSFELITRFQIANFYNKVSDVDAIEYALDNNGIIKAFQALHAKIFIFDQQYVIITSSNLTLQGLTKNYEYGIFTDEPSIVNKVCSDFNIIMSDESCKDITKEKVTDAKNILKNAPHQASINIEEVELGMRSVNEIQSNDLYTGGVKSIEKGLSGWKLDIFKVVNKIDNNKFSLSDVYQYKNELLQLHPENLHIEDKIRQQLQYLRDLEIIEFLGNGRYIKKYIS